MSWLSVQQIHEIGFGRVGCNVMISDSARFYNPMNIRMGNHVRIDDFCVISAGEGGVDIGDHIHIAVFSSIQGAGRVSLSDFCNLSSRVSVYSSNDDYSGDSMTNPTVPDRFKNVKHADVFLGKHVIVGSNSVILPGVVIGQGAAIGALSLVNSDCDSFCVYAGVPAKKIKTRSSRLLDLENELRGSDEG
ncbi:MAG: acyltransferase [Desulfobacterales bacterium]|nr:acyltransferase [Desulfobacterales bacterium]MDD3951794.1 acyltransferase [Desulfobacterales bacterium]